MKKWKATLKKLGGAYLLLRALVHSLLWRPGNWGRRPHSRSGGETTDSQTQRRDRAKNVTTLNIQWAQMSWARGLRGRRWSALLPIKHIIVWLLPDPCSTLAPGCMTYWLQCVATYTAPGAACPGMTHGLINIHTTVMCTHRHFTLKHSQQLTLANWYQFHKGPRRSQLLGGFLHSLTATNGWLH